MPRSRTSRASRHAPVSAEEVFIPDKLYFKIKEVSELTRTKPYVLRYWETEFPTLRPHKSSSGHRLYRREDVEMALEIRRLLYEQGFTIEGARKTLADSKLENRKSKIENRGSKIENRESSLEAAELRVIRRELQGILALLSRKTC